jgi:hypothetical protein
MRPKVHVCLGMIIIGIQGRFHQSDGGQAPGHVHYFPDFFHGERSAQETMFPVTEHEPLLYDLITADVIAPYLGWDVLPVGRLVQVNASGSLAHLFSASPFSSILIKMSTLHRALDRAS